MIDIYTALTFTGLGLGLVAFFIVEVLVPRKKRALQKSND
jgi:hypothetical protein